MIKKILSWFKFKKYIKITHRDPVSFETDQLIRKNQEPSKIVTKLKYLNVVKDLQPAQQILMYS